MLLEKPGKLPGQLVGRSPYLQAVQVMAPAECIGSVHRVTVDEVGSNSLFGSLADESRAVNAHSSRSLKQPCAQRIP